MSSTASTKPLPPKGPIGAPLLLHPAIVMPSLTTANRANASSSVVHLEQINAVSYLVGPAIKVSECTEITVRKHVLKTF
jgi:hypothetical protein